MKPTPTTPTTPTPTAPTSPAPPTTVALRTSSALSGGLLAALACVLVGGSFTANSVLGDYPYAGGQFLRYGLACLLLLPLLGRGGTAPLRRLSARQWARLGLLAAIGMVGFNIAVLAAERWAEPAVRFSGLIPIAAIKPDGKLSVAGGLFARKRAPDAFARYIDKRAPRARGWRLVVGHSDALADGERLLAALRERLPVVEAHLVEVGPAVGAHAGPGTLVVGLQPAPL